MKGGDELPLMKRFVAYYKPHLRLFGLDMLCALGSSGLGLLFPMITQHIINVTVPAGDMKQLALLAALLLGIYIAIAFFQYFINYWGHIMGVRMEADIREDLFNHLQKLSFSYYDENRTGKIMSRLLNDLFDITELAHHGPEDLFISAVMVLGSLGILVGIEWRLTLMLMLCIPVIAFFALTRRRRMNKAFAEVRVKTADINAQVENAISGVRVVQSFTNEAYEAERFREGNERFKLAKKHAYQAMSTFMSGMGFLTNVTNALVVVAGGYFVYLRAIDIGDLVVFLMYINLILQPIQRLTNFTQQFEQGMSGFRRFTEIMDIEPEIKDRPGAKQLNKVRGEIAFEHVDFSYSDGTEVLRDLNMTIPAGKTLALVGPSGGGKTTLCQLIPRFYDVTGGRVTVDGTDVREVTLRSLRGQIGIVQQDVFLFSGTFLDNIRYGNTDASLEEVIEAAKRANIHDFIMESENGYETDIGEKGVLLSGGQKQRLSIARAFLKNPPILILDEATSALDNETEQRIQASLEELSAGRTTLVIAHRLSTIRHADHIIVLTDEGVAEHGSHQELYAAGGIYKRLYDAQFKEA